VDALPAGAFAAEPLPDALLPQAVRHIMAIIPVAKMFLNFFISDPPSCQSFLCLIFFLLSIVIVSGELFCCTFFIFLRSAVFFDDLIIGALLQ
jgi:hypothetical protein